LRRLQILASALGVDMFGLLAEAEADEQFLKFLLYWSSRFGEWSGTSKSSAVSTPRLFAGVDRSPPDQ
jgi:hypothetical protein